MTRPCRVSSCFDLLAWGPAPCVVLLDRFAPLHTSGSGSPLYASLAGFLVPARPSDRVSRLTPSSGAVVSISGVRLYARAVPPTYVGASAFSSTPSCGRPLCAFAGVVAGDEVVPLDGVVPRRRVTLDAFPDARFCSTPPGRRPLFWSPVRLRSRRPLDAVVAPSGPSPLRLVPPAAASA